MSHWFVSGLRNSFLLFLVDEWIRFKAPAQVGVLVRELRRELDELLLRKVCMTC